MTDREKAIVMAYTGACMLTGDKLQIFHKYVEEIMGRPIWTHEMAQLADEIKEKSKDDFMALCADKNEQNLRMKQESVLDKIRAEIAEYGSIWVAYAITGHSDRDIENLIEGVLKQAKEQVLNIIDKYRTESEE